MAISETDFKTNAAVALVVAEVTKGTFVDPTVANVEMYDVAPIKVDTSPVRVGNLSDGTMKKGKQYSGTQKGSTSGKIELKSSGDATVAPAIAEFLKASGMIEQVVNTTDVGYLMNGIPSCDTMSFKYQSYNCGALPAGFKQTLRGARCNFKISAAAVGAPVIIDLEIMGAAGAEDDVASGAPLVAIATDTTECEKFMGVTTVIGAEAVNMTSFEFAGNFALTPREDSREVSGVAYSDITDMDMTLTASWATHDVLAKDYYGDMIADVVYNEIKFTLQNWELIFTGAQIYDLSHDDNNGFMGNTATVQVEKYEMNQI